METHKGKVRAILCNGKRARVARSHSLCEIGNEIPGLKAGDVVECSDFAVIRKLDAKAGDFQGSGKQNAGIGTKETEPEQEFSPEQMERLTLLMLYLQSWNENGVARAWKGYDFDVLNKLNEKGFVNDRRGNKSLYITEKGIEEAKKIMAKPKFGE